MRRQDLYYPRSRSKVIISVTDKESATPTSAALSCYILSLASLPMGDPANFNLWGERSTPEYLLPKRGFDTCTRVVSAIESPLLFFLAPKKQKIMTK